MVRLQLARAKDTIASISRQQVRRYLDYWQQIEPKDNQDYYERWLFAFMSVRTQWQRNCALFEAFRSLPRAFTKAYLLRRLKAEGSGMVEVRAQGIWDFHHKFWDCPQAWYPRREETMLEARDRLVEQIYGLGITKVSFVMEMAFPATCGVVCIDTHISRLYGVPLDQLNDSAYRHIEKHWVDQCLLRRMPSAIVRHAYWDTVQHEKDTRYWSYVFERGPIEEAS